MTEQNSFFPSTFELFQQANPERFARGQKGSNSGGRRRSSTGSKRSAPEPKVYNCETCGLWGKQSGNLCTQVKRYGRGDKKILFIGQCPGKEEMRLLIPFMGPAGQLLKTSCSMVGLDLDIDCIRTNVLGCYPGAMADGRDKTPSIEQIRACKKHLEQDIAEVQPDLIVCLGDQAVNAVLDKPKGCKFRGSFSAGILHGMVIPSHKHNCWVASSYHPAYYLYRRRKDNTPDDSNLLAFDIAVGLGYIDQPLPQPLTEDGNIMLTDVDEIVTLLEEISASGKPTAFDYETFRLTPYEDEAEILSVAFSQDPSLGYFIPINKTNPETGDTFFNEEETARICDAWRGFLASDGVPKVVQNLNMEDLWSSVCFRQPIVNFIHDTMVAAHVIHCNRDTTSLAFQVFEMCGHDYKDMVDPKDLRNAPLNHLFHYNTWDARYTIMSYYRQLSTLEFEGRLAEFNALLSRAAQTLVRLRERGVKISTDVLTQMETQYGREKDQRFDEMEASMGVQTYLAQKNENVKPGKEIVFNPESNPQLGTILYKTCGEPIRRKTASSDKTGIGSTDIDALEYMQRTTTNDDVRRFISSLFRYRKCSTLLKRAANYRNVMDCNNFVHPCYNLNIADTYRSSADGPNIQNVFKHDKELKRFRMCIVAITPDRIILEVDYKGLEVCVTAMVSGDPELIRQIKEGVDTHKRWAAEIYQRDESTITSEERQDSKNQFVFPSIYGATAESIARAFKDVDKEHIIRTQEKFWNEFQGVKEWQIRTIEKYRKCGYVEGVSGFRRYGPLDVNKIYNTPIQGPAFHLLLDSLTRIDVEMMRQEFRSFPIFEIHDSIAIDVVPSEARQVVDLVTEIMCSKRFEWQGDVPLAVDWECGVDSWYDLAKLSFNHCSLCNTDSPFSVSRVSRMGVENREVPVDIYQCGTCKQKQEVLVAV